MLNFKLHSLPLSLLIIIASLLSACSQMNTTANKLNSTAVQKNEVVYNPQTQQGEEHDYTPYYQLKTQLLPRHVELLLTTQLQKKTVPGVYTIKEYTRRLLPNDYLADGDSKLYLKNISEQAIMLNIMAVVIEQQRLPFSGRKVTLAAGESATLSLGKVAVDLRLTTLNVRIEYQASGKGIMDEHQEKQLDMLRIIKNTEDK